MGGGNAGQWAYFIARMSWNLAGTVRVLKRINDLNKK